MRKSIKRDRGLRLRYSKREQGYLDLKSVFLNRYLDGKIREKARLSLAKEGGVLGKVHNRCVLSGRSKGVIRNLRVSRMAFKEMASAGVLRGIGKSSW
jgi:small subunit ribosomal protein S14